MAVTIPTTRTEAKEQYDANLAYDLNGSVSQCNEFIAACRWLLRDAISRSEKDGESLELDLKVLQSSLNKAETWRASNINALSSTGAPRVSYVDVSLFRT